MIQITIDPERLEDIVTVDEYLAMQERDMRAIIDVMSKFVVKADGTYYDYDDGRKIVGKLSLRELTEASKSLSGKIRDVIVPPQNVSD